MAASAGNMADGLNKMLGDLAKLAANPDADLDFLTKLQMAITDYMRSGGGQQQQQPTPPGPQMAAGGTGAMGGAMQGMGSPNPDELRRMMAGMSGGQGG